MSEAGSENKEYIEIAKQIRAAVYQDEGFLIGMHQVLSAAALGGAISYHEKLIRIFGVMGFSGAVAISGVCLSLSIISANERGRYKVWALKAIDSKEKNESEKYACRSKKAGKALVRMRKIMEINTYASVVGVVFLVVSVVVASMHGWMPTPP